MPIADDTAGAFRPRIPRRDGLRGADIEQGEEEADEEGEAEGSDAAQGDDPVPETGHGGPRRGNGDREGRRAGWR